jgi:nitric oxide reductase NorD protein
MNQPGATPHSPASNSCGEAHSPALDWLASALDLPAMTWQWQALPSSRWRTLGAPGQLRLQPAAPHALHRLQIARAALDHAPDGRWALHLSRATALAWLGPHAEHPPAPGDSAASRHRQGQPPGQGQEQGQGQPGESPAGQAPAQHDAHPELDIHALIASWPHPVLLRRLFVWLDGQRVDAALTRNWAGAQRDVPLDPAPALVHTLPWPQPAANAREALQRALHLHAALLTGRWRVRHGQWLPSDEALALGSGSDVPGAPQLPSSGPALARDGALPGDASAADAGATDARQAAPGADAGAQSDQHQGDDGTNPADPANGAGADAGSTANLPAHETDALQRAGQADNGASGSHGDGESESDTSLTHDAPDIQAKLAHTPQHKLPQFDEQGQPITWHDEWDHAQRRYLRRWTAVHTQRVAGKALDYLSDVRQRHAALARPIRRHLLRLEADARLRERRLLDGEHIDLDAVLDERASASPEGRIYQSQLQRTREVSVALLLDLSGSTSFVLPPSASHAAQSGQAHADMQQADDEDDDFLWATAKPHQVVPPARRVLDVFKEGAVLMADALHGLGHRFAVWGFSGEGRLQVDFLHFKDFDQGWGTREAAALGAAMPRGYTRMGAAVRHATQLLVQEPARRRLLIVLSDGYPQDRDYGPRPDEPSHGVADTARALREAEQAGVGHFQLSVDAAAHDYLRRMGKPGSYRVVADVEALPRELLRLAQRLRNT